MKPVGLCARAAACAHAKKVCGRCAVPAVARLLDSAEGCLRRCAEQLELDVLIIRKERAVGIIADPSAVAHVPGGGWQRR